MVIQALSAAVVVTGVGVCITTQLAATPESHGVPGRVVYETVGEIAADACKCGQLALSIARDYPSRTFPVDSSLEPVDACHSRPLAYEVNASLFWCVPTMDARGKPPPPADLLASALMFEGDAFALRSAIECCLADMKRVRQIWDWRVGAVTRDGPEGGCAATSVTFVFQLI